MREPDSFGRYRVFDCVGSGGMATVHRATVELQQGEVEVALKRLLPHLADYPQVLEDFIREAKLAANLHHPNIVRVYELGRTEGTYFIAMELVRGVSLMRVLRAGKPGPIGPVLALMLEMLEALDYAHDGVGGDGQPNRLVHRDLTPSNLLITDDGHIKIIDFGVAKALGGDLATNSGNAKGKLGYMAPEALRAKGIDGRTDLFSAGVVIWELLAGRRLFQPSHEFDLEALEAPLEPPSRYNRDCSPAIDALVLKAVERDPNRRWQTAAAMHRALALATRPYASNATVSDVLAWLEALREPSGAYVGYEVMAEELSIITPATPQPVFPRAPRPPVTTEARTGRGWAPEPTTDPSIIQYSHWPIEGTTQPRQGAYKAPPAAVPEAVYDEATGASIVVEPVEIDSGVDDFAEDTRHSEPEQQPVMSHRKTQRRVSTDGKRTAETQHERPATTRAPTPQSTPPPARTPMRRPAPGRTVDRVPQRHVVDTELSPVVPQADDPTDNTNAAPPRKPRKR